MKKKTLDIDIDFLGGQGPLTVEEEKALSDFFRKRKKPIKNPAIGRRNLYQRKSKHQFNINTTSQA